MYIYIRVVCIYMTLYSKTVSVIIGSFTYHSSLQLIEEVLSKEVIVAPILAVLLISVPGTALIMYTS